MESLLLMVAMIAVFYLRIISPENKRKKQAEQNAAREALRLMGYDL